MTHAEASLLVAAQVEELKRLYAELFLLMCANAQEPAGEPDAGRLNATINNLMGEIETQTRTLRERVASARHLGGIAREVEAGLDSFQKDLREGLELMSTRIQQRVAELGEEQARVGEQLRQLSTTRAAARGYGARPAGAAVMRSEI